MQFVQHTLGYKHYAEVVRGGQEVLATASGPQVLCGRNDSADSQLLPAGRCHGLQVIAHLQIEVGDNLEAMTPAGRQELTVGGVVASTEYLWPARSRQDFLTSPDDFGVVFVSESVLDKLHSPAVTPQVTVRFTSSADNDALEGEIAATAQRLGALDTFTREEQPSNALLQEDVQGFGELSLMFPLLFLGAAGMATYILLTRMVYAQRMQIGLLLANGFRRRSAFLHYLSFGLAASLAGAIPGMLAGIL